MATKRVEKLEKLINDPSKKAADLPFCANPEFPSGMMLCDKVDIGKTRTIVVYILMVCYTVRRRGWKRKMRACFWPFRFYSYQIMNHAIECSASTEKDQAEG